MMDRKIVVGLGEILWDVFPDRKVLGGAPANFAYHVSQLGLDGYAVGAVGDDALGRGVLSALGEKGLNCLIETTEYPTGTVEITLDDKGVPAYTITENVAWDHIPFTERTEKLARSASAVCFGSLAQRSAESRDTIRRFLEAMPAESLRIFDINLRCGFYTEQIVVESIRMADLLKINDEELVVVAAMFGWQGTEEELGRRLREKFGLDMLILTKGASGSSVFFGEGVSFLPTPVVEVADTVGAGDSFTAAFTAALLCGEPVAEAHRLAVEVSAYVCRHHGAMPPLGEEHKDRFR